jgi:hypothetical protein
MTSIRLSRFATSVPARAPFSNGRLWPAEALVNQHVAHEGPLG